MAGHKVSKRAVKSNRADKAFDRRCQNISLQRRMCRQMLDQVLRAGHQLELPSYVGLTKERVAEMRQTFAKGPIDRNRSKRIADSRRREAGLADLRRALDFINLHGIKRKQNEDGSYEPLEDEDGKETIDEEDKEEAAEEEEEDDEEGESDGAETEEGCQKGQPDSDIEMGDEAGVETISRGVRRLKLVVHRKE